MTEQLKPCPFCGGEVSIEKNELGCWVVRCQKCPLDFGRYWYAKKQQVKEKWNRGADNNEMSV